MAMLDLLTRTARTRRIAGKSCQVGCHVVGMLHMTLATYVTDIAWLIQDQRAKSLPPIENAGFDFKAQGRGRFEGFDEHGGWKTLKTARQQLVVAETPQRGREGVPLRVF